MNTVASPQLCYSDELAKLKRAELGLVALRALSVVYDGGREGRVAYDGGQGEKVRMSPVVDVVSERAADERDPTVLTSMIDPALPPRAWAWEV
uniref:Cell division control protein n=1 Tax=Ganoderma boninense TaxID=34458 RepID=A0A5K1K4T5_9APHY|nr:Cell division control protein [Ganoderma boninense]